MIYVLVGLGGIFGSIIRFCLGEYIKEKGNKSFPVGTFIINVTGAIILGIVNALNLRVNLHAFLADGFLGAYTTFSTFMYEGFSLFEKNEKLNALSYIILTVILGLLVYTLGFMLGKAI